MTIGSTHTQPKRTPQTDIISRMYVWRFWDMAVFTKGENIGVGIRYSAVLRCSYLSCSWCPYWAIWPLSMYRFKLIQECPSKRIDYTVSPHILLLHQPTAHHSFPSVVTRTNIGSRRFFWGHEIDMVHSSIVSHHYLRRQALFKVSPSKYRVLGNSRVPYDRRDRYSVR